MLVTDELPDRYSMEQAARTLTLGPAKLFNRIDRLEAELHRAPGIERSRLAFHFLGKFGGKLGQEQTQEILDWFNAGGTNE